MKLSAALNQCNQFEKTKFINLLDNVCQEQKRSDPKLNKVLDEIDDQLKKASADDVSKLFSLVKEPMLGAIRDGIEMSDPALSPLLKILSRDGAKSMSLRWFEDLYNREMSKIKENIDQIKKRLGSEEARGARVKALSVYYSCVKVAYENDLRVNRECHISADERIILNELASELGISNDEATAIEFSIVGIKPLDIRDAIEKLRELGVILHNKKTDRVMVPDELSLGLLSFEGRRLPEKAIRLCLYYLENSELNRVLKQFDIPSRGLDREEKIKKILETRTSLAPILKEYLHSTESVSDKKARLKNLIDDLGLDVSKLGSKIEDRVEIILASLASKSSADMTILTSAGYQSLFEAIKNEFGNSVFERLGSLYAIESKQIQDADALAMFGISPIDLLTLLTTEELSQLRDVLEISNYGFNVYSIIEMFTDAEEKFVENFDALARRDLATLSAVGIEMKEGDVGVKFEEITKSLLSDLGMNVDETRRRELNDKKNQIDILITLGDDEVLLVECKTCKSGDYSKYSSVSRQLKAYEQLLEAQGLRVAQSLLIAPSFSKDFIDDSEYDADINTSLLTADGLKTIRDAHRSAKRNFTPKLLMKGGLLKVDRIVKALQAR